MYLLLYMSIYYDAMGTPSSRNSDVTTFNCFSIQIRKLGPGRDFDLFKRISMSQQPSKTKMDPMIKETFTAKMSPWPLNKPPAVLLTQVPWDPVTQSGDLLIKVAVKAATTHRVFPGPGPTPEAESEPGKSRRRSEPGADESCPWLRPV